MGSMREKLESLNLATLKDLAKHRGVKGSSTMKKAVLIEALLTAGGSADGVSGGSADGVSGGSADGVADGVTNGSADGVSNVSAESVGEGANAKSDKAPEERLKTAFVEEESTVKASAPAQPKKDVKTAEKEQLEHVRARGVSERQNFQQTQSENLEADGILEVMQDGFGFIRCENFLPGENDVYVAPGLIRRFGLKTGDMLNGITRGKSQNEKFAALVHLNTINGYTPEKAMKRVSFDQMTPIFPDKKLTLECHGCGVSMRIMDLISPIGKGQRGMIVSPPKAGKTTLLKEVAKSIKRNYPDIHLIVLLIDERPEEVTDIKEDIEGPNAEVIYSTFDELPEHHKRVSEMVIERARRLVEHGQDVMIFLDSITRLARAYNQVIPPSGRTLSGGLDPAALHMPKRFFGAARNMREGGSLTILATALIETGSKMDDVVYEEFKGTGNMEMILDRRLQERRVFPAINIPKSSTRREDLLLTEEELDAVNRMRKSFNSMKGDDAVDQVISLFTRTRTNKDFVHLIEKQIL